MKALRWHGREDIRYEDIPEPSPRTDQVKIKVHMAGICGSDLKEYSHGPGLIDVEKAPLVIGHEFVGEVAEVGKGVAGLEIGDRVTSIGNWVCGECYYCKRGIYNLCLKPDFIGINVDGCMAEYLVAPGYTCYKIPDSVPDEAGALVEPLAVAVHAVRQGNVRTGDTVAVIGDGTIGLCSLLAARTAGASEVYVVAKHENRGKLASALGATKVIYINDGNPVQHLRDLTCGLGADVSIECVGHADTPQLSVELVRKGGTAVIVGVFEQPSAFRFSDIGLGEKIVVGSSIYVDEAGTVIALLADGRINPAGLVESLVTSRVLLKDAIEQGFKHLIAHKEANMKVLIQMP